MAVPQKIVLKSTTKMSLNDRFSAISSQPRPVQNIRTKMAVAAQASAKNRRLAQQMANRPTVQAALKIKQRTLQQRLGTPRGSSNVKSRLSLGPRGRGRGLSGRLGSPNVGRGRGRSMTRGTRGGRGSGRATRYMQRGGRQLRGNQRGGFRGGIANRFTDGPRGRGGWRGRGSFDQIRGGGRGRGRGSRGRGGRGRGSRGRGDPAPSKEALDSQLDTYMSKTKSNLDSELDSYMSQTDL